MKAVFGLKTKEDVFSYNKKKMGNMNERHFKHDYKSWRLLLRFYAQKICNSDLYKEIILF